MKQFRLKDKISPYLDGIRLKKTIGFVPTMGSLHKGHESLINIAKSHCDIVVCSIFINPTQFNDKEDFDRYPRKMSLDIERLKSVNCHILYSPEIKDIYSKNEGVKSFDFEGLDRYMEGIFRKDHFNGDATVINKLFKIINPDKAFFGEKDLQQLQIIRHITKKLHLNVEIVGCPTIREDSGLAMSSRNKLLNNIDSKKAAFIYHCLQKIKDNSNKKTVQELKIMIVNEFESNKDFVLEYCEVVSLSTLQPVNSILSRGNNAACIAASINGVRLIDNIIF